MSGNSVWYEQGIDGIIQEEAELLIRTLLDDSTRNKGSISLSGQNLNVAVVNVLWQMVASKRFDWGVQSVTGFWGVFKEAYSQKYYSLFALKSS